MGGWEERKWRFHGTSSVGRAEFEISSGLDLGRGSLSFFDLVLGGVFGVAWVRSWMRLWCGLRGAEFDCAA